MKLINYTLSFQDFRSSGMITEHQLSTKNIHKKWFEPQQKFQRKLHDSKGL